jgi:hypothetical protein
MGQNDFYCEKIIAVLFVLSAGFLLFYLGMPVVNFGCRFANNSLVLTSLDYSFKVSKFLKNQAANSKD